MTQFAIYVGSGVAYGCVYGLLAIGLVLTYRTSGVYNLAFGALAYVVALLYGASRQAHWPEVLSFILWVLVFAPAMGILLERALLTFVRSKSFTARLLPMVGLLISIPPIAMYLRGRGTPRPYPVFFSPSTVYFRVGSYPVNGGLLAAVIFTAAALLLLGWLLKYTILGIRMRAVVQSPRLLQLAGTDSDLVSAFAWGLSSALAGLAGVLLAPILHSIDPISMTALLLAATAGAAVAGFVGIVAGFLGSLGLGIVQELAAGYLPSSASWYHSIRPSLPFILLLVAVVLNRRLSISERANDPMSVVDVPPPPLEHTRRSTLTNVRIRAATVAVLAVGIWASISYLSASLVEGVINSLALAVIFLSFTVSAGIGGQISLCQASFAGFGAFLAAQLAHRFDFPIFFGVLLGAVGAAIVGALVALPSVRLGGLAVSLLTLGFALLCDNLLFPSSYLGNGATGLPVPRPQLGSISLASARALFFVFVAILVLAGLIVVRIRDGYLGESLKAIASSERGAESIGLNLLYARVVLFATSAFLAGLGGGMYAMAQTYVAPIDFVYQISLVWVVVALAFGVKTVDGAIIGAFAFEMLAVVIPNTRAGSFGPLEYIAFGVASIYFAAHPEGLVEHARRLIGEGIRALKARGEVKTAPSAR